MIKLKKIKILMLIKRIILDKIYSIIIVNILIKIIKNWYNNKLLIFYLK